VCVNVMLVLKCTFLYMYSALKTGIHATPLSHISAPTCWLFCATAQTFKTTTSKNHNQTVILVAANPPASPSTSGRLKRLAAIRLLFSIAPSPRASAGPLQPVGSSSAVSPIGSGRPGGQLGFVTDRITVLPPRSWRVTHCLSAGGPLSAVIRPAPLADVSA
jgi:hypothetical protein